MHINKDLLIFGALIGSVVAVLTLVEKIRGAANALGQGAADLVPQGVYDAIAGPKVRINANVVLPTGQVVSFDRIIDMGGSLRHEGGERYIFTYNGFSYRVVPPRRADGNYSAVRV